MARPAPHHRAGPCCVLALQGGGALGAYHIGAYQALAECGFEPEWFSGISIGAINAAIMAGNPPERRLQALEAFWEMISARAAAAYRRARARHLAQPDEQPAGPDGGAAEFLPSPRREPLPALRPAGDGGQLLRHRPAAGDAARPGRFRPDQPRPRAPHPRRHRCRERGGRLFRQPPPGADRSDRARARAGQRVPAARLPGDADRWPLLLGRGLHLQLAGRGGGAGPAAGPHAALHDRPAMPSGGWRQWRPGRTRRRGTTGCWT